MSMERTDYVILGFDLTPYMDKIYTEEWCTDENIDMWESYQSKGHVQLFSDPMSGLHLYFGYILSAQNEYDKSETIKINLADNDELDINEKYDLVLENLIKAYGFEDIVVIIGLDSENVNVIAKTDELTTDDAIKISTVIYEENIASPENIKIIPIA